MNQFNTDNKDPLVCPYCNQKIIQAAGVTPGHSGTIRKDQLFVCASCGHLSRVGDFNLQIISDEEFRSMPAHIQMAVDGIVKTITDKTVIDRRN